MTMVMMTAVAIVKETERGTMEMLIATPVRAIEVMHGKILPYVFVGYAQTGVFLLTGLTLFGVPFEGSGWAFFLGFNLFVVVNLALDFLISANARSQMQAMQLSMFTCLRCCSRGFCFLSPPCPAGRRSSAMSCRPRTC